MKKQIITGVVGLAVVGAVAGSAYWLGNHRKSADTTATTKSTTNQPTTSTSKPTVSSASTSTTPASKQPTIDTYDPAGLFNASETRRLTDFTPWQDSAVTVKYVDYNKDGINDAFVWAKLPGTKGYSFAAVWTIGANDQPKELWYVPTAEQFVQSSWSTNGTTFTETGSIESPKGLDPQTNNYHWQGNTFVTY